MATERLSVRVDADLERSPEEAARRERRSASWLAVEAIEALLHARAEKGAAIRTAVEEAEEKVFVSREAMDEWGSRVGRRCCRAGTGTGYPTCPRVSDEARFLAVHAGGFGVDADL